MGIVLHDELNQITSDNGIKEAKQRWPACTANSDPKHQFEIVPIAVLICIRESFSEHRRCQIPQVVSSNKTLAEI